jgi:hypothetical protein
MYVYVYVYCSAVWVVGLVEVVFVWVEVVFVLVLLEVGSFRKLLVAGDTLGS